jgi:hypothetical protein
MKGRNQLWFTSKQEFYEYIHKYMVNAEQVTHSLGVTIETKLGTVIAKWDNDCGQVFEGRSKERLEKEKAK